MTCHTDVRRVWKLLRERPDVHVCGEYQCHICKKFVTQGHLCYMQREQPKKPNDNLIFYDFETDFSSGEHVANYAVAQYSDGKEFVFKGYNALHEFCEFLFATNHKNYIAVAHNAKAFDAIFIQRWLVENRPTADINVFVLVKKLCSLHWQIIRYV